MFVRSMNLAFLRTSFSDHVYQLLTAELQKRTEYRTVFFDVKEEDFSVCHCASLCATCFVAMFHVDIYLQPLFPGTLASWKAWNEAAEATSSRYITSVFCFSYMLSIFRFAIAAPHRVVCADALFFHAPHSSPRRSWIAEKGSKRFAEHACLCFCSLSHPFDCCQQAATMHTSKSIFAITWCDRRLLKAPAM